MVRKSLTYLQSKNISALSMKLNIIKNESGKARSVEHVPLLFKYDDINIYSYQAAEAFNKFFLNLFF
jgi:hypothetical protein